MRKNPGLFFGLFIFGLLIAGIITAYFWTPYDPEAFVASALEPPTLRHIFGTDDFGRDIFSRVMKGAGTTLAVGAFTIVIGALVGLFIGAVTGYFGGAFDEIIMRINDAITAFPSILLALVIISLLGPEKTSNLVIALGARATCASCSCISCPISFRCFCLPSPSASTTRCCRKLP